MATRGAVFLLLFCAHCVAQSSTRTPSATASPTAAAAPPAAGGVPSGLSATELAVTYGFSEAVSTLSFLGSLSILFCYARYTPLRKFSFTLIAILSATDVLNQMFDFVGPPALEIEMMAAAPGDLTPRCWAQALGNAVFELSSVLWTGCIAWTLYALVWLGWRPDAVERALPRMVGVALGVPALLMAAPFIVGQGQVYGPAGAWCAIRPAYWYLNFVVFYAPLWATMAFNAFVHLRTLRRLRALTGSAASNAASGVDAATADKLGKVMERLKFYPFILLVVWGPASVNRVAEALSGGRAFAPLFFLHRVFSSSQGLLNALLYGFSRGVRDAVAADLHALWPSRFPAPPASAALAAAPSPAAPGAAQPRAQQQTEEARGSAGLLAAGAGGAVDAAGIFPAAAATAITAGAPPGEDADDIFVEVPRKE